MGWYAIFCVRDSVKSIKQVIDSLLNQSISPMQINIIDDGSSDGTKEIIESYHDVKSIKIFETCSKTRDYSRLPSMWNMGLEKRHFFHMIGAGDVTYEKDYAEILLNEFEVDRKLVTASGDFDDMNISSPHGAGRFVRQDFFHRYVGQYKTIVGYESEILFQALMNDFKNKVFPNAKMYHHEKLGGGHKFSEWGWGMRSLGYHPLYVLGRCALAFYKNQDVGRMGALNMLYRYMTFKQTGGYFQYFPKPTRKAISDYQVKYMKDKIRGVLK